MELGRRGLAGLGLAVGATGLVGCARSGAPRADGPATTSAAPTRRQPGVDRPVPRPAHVVVRALDVRRGAPADALAALTAAVSDSPDGVVATVGLSATVARTLSPAAADLVADLPEFLREEIAPADRGGDLLLQLAADDEATLTDTWAGVAAALGDDVVPRWSQAGFRGETDGEGARNLLGFYDGIAVPESPTDLDDGVWTQAGDGLADATVVVVRRMRLDLAGFGALGAPAQENVFGRHKDTGAPLSGGGFASDVDLQAKSAEGVYDVPLSAHARRAHPFVSGAERLMMRRSYSYDNGPGDAGLLFVSFQRELSMFVDTLRSMDELDALMPFTTTTASGSWLVPPWDGRAPLQLDTT